MKLSLSAIQNAPVQVRIRILWISSLVFAVLLMGIWFLSAKHSIRNADTSDIKSILNQNTQESITVANGFITVERVEKSDGLLKVFFKASNNTNGILNFSKADHISLLADNHEAMAKSMTDRQGATFVAKILSNTQKYGIVVFEDPVTDTATIKFDNLFFESDNQVLFNESYKLDFKALDKPLEPRS